MHTRFCLSICWGAMVVLSPASTQANGGPIAESSWGLTGDIQPLQDNFIRLLEEQLKVALDKDGFHYRVAARYFLRNPGKPTKVAYGVPFFSISPPTGSEGGKFNDVKIEVEGKSYPCRLRKAQKGKLAIEQVASKHDLTELEDINFGWCVAKLEIPSGERVQLDLSHPGELFYSDTESTFSRFQGHSDRGLVYALFPAGYWKGPVERVTITIDAGRFQEHVHLLEPINARLVRHGDQHEIVLNNVDLKRMPYLVLNIGIGTVLDQQHIVSVNRGRRYPKKRHYTFKASSTLTAQGKVSYGVEKAFDGRSNTAWCEGVPGPRIGEWVELELDMLKSGDSMWGMAVVPGYAANERICRSNNRLRKIGIGPCGRKKAK